jgi:hypothetical protein
LDSSNSKLWIIDIRQWICGWNADPR